MTDEEAIDIVAKILKLAPSFGRVGNLRPEIHVKLNPLRVRIGELFLSGPKAIAIANGSLKVEARALGWVITEETPKQRGGRPVMRKKPMTKAERKREYAERRAEYLREVDVRRKELETVLRTRGDHDLPRRLSGT